MKHRQLRTLQILHAPGVVLLLALAACGGDPSGVAQPAPSASDPACAALLSRLPGTLLNRPAGSTGETGAAVWGDPAIRLQCGVTPPGPTSDSCIDADGVDWVFSEDQGGYHFVTYGRTPALELVVPAAIDRTAAPGALAQLAEAVKPLPVNRACVGPGDVQPSST